MKRLLALLALPTLIAAGMALSPMRAAAGSNGQQLSMFNDLGWSSVCYYGENNANNYVLGCGAATENAWNEYRGWWWKYDVDFGSNSSVNYGYVIVPVSQTDNYTCFYGPDYTAPFACNGT